MIPWNNEQQVNIFTNEYSYKIGVNRSLDRLRENDQFIDDSIESNLDRAIGLRIATYEQVSALSSSPSAAVSPGRILALSANYDQTVNGLGSSIERFIVPYHLAQALEINSIISKIMYIDIQYKGNMLTKKQVEQTSLKEINNAEILAGNIIYVRCTYQGDEKMMTFRTNNPSLPWTFVRERDLFALVAHRRTFKNAKSLEVF